MSRRHVVALAFMAFIGVLSVVPGRAGLLRLVSPRTTVQMPGHRATPSTNTAGTQPPLQASAVRERYETIFNRDPVDVKWTERARGVANKQLAALLPKGSAIRSFECRALMCRLETSHQDRDHYFEFARRAFLRASALPWDAATYSASPSGDPADGLMVTYIAREGQPLPAIVNAR